MKTVRRSKGANNVFDKVRVHDTPLEADLIISYESDLLFEEQLLTINHGGIM